MDNLNADRDGDLNKSPDANRDPISGAPGAHPAGMGIGGAIDPAAEDAYWRDNYSASPHVQPDRGYEYYHPAYRYGWESRTQQPKRRWEEIESELERGWDRFKGESKLTWNEAKAAAKEAWNRIERAKSRDTSRVSNAAVSNASAISGNVGGAGAAGFSGTSGNTGVGGTGL